MRRPKLFLLDEPLSNLDARLRASVRLELKRLHQRIKGTIIYVTHDQVEAMTLGDQVVVLRDGKVIQTGRPATIYAHPVNTFVATFIGSPEMNLYKGELIYRDGRPYFRGAGYFLALGEIKQELKEGPLEVGIRPEDIHIVKDGTTELKAFVDMITNIGSENYIHARLGDDSITLRAPKETTLRPGMVLSLSIDPGHLHIFHKGRRI